jgi:hypothetical protein
VPNFEDSLKTGWGGALLVNILPFLSTGERKDGVNVTDSPGLKKAYDGLEHRRNVKGFVQQGASAWGLNKKDNGEKHAS